MGSEVHMSFALRRDARARVGWLLAGMLALAFAGLAHWQWQRAGEKVAQLAARDRVLAERRPVPVAVALARDVHALAWFAGSGRFETPALLLDNQVRDGMAGVRVYARLAFTGQDTRLLVDLGWLPWSAARVLPTVALPSGPVAISGLLAPPPAIGIRFGALPKLDAAAVLLTRIDPDELSAQLRQPLAARVLRLDPALPIGYPRDLELLANSLPPERHRGYAVQWAALALAVLIWTAWRLRVREETSA